MKIKRATKFGALSALGLSCVMAMGTAFAKEPADITAKLKKALPQVQIESVSESPVPGVYAVEVLGNGIIYMSEDGGHFIAGDLYRVDSNGLANVTEEKMNTVRAKALLAVKQDQMITFPAKGKEKAKLTVFTDIDCGYCRKFHQEVPELNSLGISVSYMAFPRAGVGSSSYNKYVSVWCSSDQQASMDKAKQRKPVDPATCENPVEEQYLLGQQVGVNSTPNLVTESGELIRGYVPAKQLAQRLGIN
jgi:thiol:disulfide interchange protein DsbC